MKEFRADTGGRYTYNEDVLNLQDLALAFNEIFADCDNFIVSGCAVNGQTIGEGYVYINKKLRYFSGASGITQWPQYIYEVNHSENTAYASGGPKIARTVYGCQIASQQPSAPDPITGQLPGVLPIPLTGGKTINDAFFGKYALLLNPSGSSQTVDKVVNFGNNINVAGAMSANDGFKVSNGNVSARFYCIGNILVVESRFGSNRYQFEITNDSGFRFYANGVLCLSVNNNGGITCNVPISGNKATFGGLALTGNKLYQSSAASESTLYINSVGHNGGMDYFRNTVIGNGKGNDIVSINGASKAIFANGPVYIDSGVATGLLLKASHSKTSMEMQSSILWQDCNSNTTAQMGFTSNTDNIFRFFNSVSSILIYGVDCVNIGPAIRENGILLSDKYVLKSSYNSSMTDKADLNGVYTKSEADNKFASRDGAFTQFLSHATAAELRSQIDAPSTGDLSRYALLSNYLSDMATSEAAKAKIRANIGACAAGDFQSKMLDTGWQYISDSYGLYVRQIGNIVSIQGVIRIVHSGIVFTLPNTIDCPSYGVMTTLALENTKSWSCEIPPNQRNCIVKYCNGSCNKTTYFSLTYMV